jgi:hypothetical protein
MTYQNRISMLAVCIAALLAFCQPMAHAQIFNSTWQGGTGDWDNPTNWSTLDAPDNLPTVFYNVFITGGGDTVNMLGLKEIDSLAIGGGGVLNIGNNSVLTIINEPSRTSSGVLVNSGIISLNATNLGSTLRFDGTVMLSGGGTIMMGNDAGNQLTGVNNGMLINVDNLIQGSGTIGTANTLAFVNQGQVVANQSVPLTIIMTQGVTNENLFRATDGGTLNLTGGILTNVGGTIEALDNSLVNLTAANIDGGLLRTEGTGFFDVFGATIFDSTANQVTVDGTVNISNNNKLTVLGDLINKQNINLNATSLSSRIDFDGDVSLSGGGVINLGDDSNNVLGGVNNGKLINVDHLIRGSGTIGIANTLELVNQSTIEADQATPLTIVAGQGVNNQGTLRAKDGATMNITGGIVQNSTGLIEAADGSLVHFQSATIVGGMLQSLGTGSMSAAATTFDGSGSGISLNGTLDVGNNQTITFIGLFENQTNTVNLNATSLTSRLQISGPVELIGGGTIQMANDNGAQITGINSGILTNQDNIIRGSGSIGVANSLQFINRGIVEAHQSVPLTVFASQGVTNENIMRAVDGATLELSGGTIDNQLGQLSATNGSTILLNNATIQGGDLFADATSTFVSQQSVLDGTLSSVNLDGTITVGNNLFLGLRGAIFNSANTIELNATSLQSRLNIDGAVNLSGGGSVRMADDNGSVITGVNGGFLTNENNTISGAGEIGLNAMGMINRGTIDATGTFAMRLDPNAAGFLNDVGGLMRVSGAGGMVFLAGNHTNRGTVLINPSRALTINSGANFNNDGGDVIVGVGGSITTTGTYLQTDGSTHVDGQLTSTVMNDFNGGVLSGSGAINGISDFEMATTIAPGSSIGILDFNDNLTMGGTFDIELASNLVENVAQDIAFVNTGIDDSLIGFDQVNVFGILTLEDGTSLDLSRVSGFFPEVGDFFDILTGDSIVMLGSLNISTGNPGLTFSSQVLTLFDQTTGTNRDVLRITTLTAVPEPNSALAIGIAIAIAANLRRRRIRLSA